jgi:hypothetical protein
MNSLDPPFATSRHWAGLRRVQLAVLTAVALLALARLVGHFDADALTIASLSAMLIWVVVGEQQRREELGRRVDYLLALQRYGPLSAEDLEVIAALSPGSPAPAVRSGRTPGL